MKYINKLLICGEFVLERIRFHIFYFKKHTITLKRRLYYIYLRKETKNTYTSSSLIIHLHRTQFVLKKTHNLLVR